MSDAKTWAAVPKNVKRAVFDFMRTANILTFSTSKNFVPPDVVERAVDLAAKELRRLDAKPAPKRHAQRQVK